MSRSPGHMLGCAYTICSYGQILVSCPIIIFIIIVAVVVVVVVVIIIIIHYQRITKFAMNISENEGVTRRILAT